jgi:two-component sensor histidine kinase
MQVGRNFRSFHPYGCQATNSGAGRGKADDMTIELLPYCADSPLDITFERPESRTVGSYERELTVRRRMENRLRKALVRNRALLRQKDELIQNERLLSRESDHRLLNGLQMIVALLSLQSRASANSEAASELAAAANRVTMIERVHRHLHCLDGAQTVDFKQFIEELGRDFSKILSSNESAEQVLVVEGVEIKLPSVTAIPLGFIVSELITNAAKYGNGRIAVKLEPNPGKGYALSVSNDGPSLPEGFDPAACKGLGMRIIRSLVKQIGGKLRIGRSDNNQGARFTVQFS